MQNNPSLLFVQNKLFCPVPKLFGIKKRGESLRFRVWNQNFLNIITSLWSEVQLTYIFVIATCLVIFRAVGIWVHSRDFHTQKVPIVQWLWSECNAALKADWETSICMDWILFVWNQKVSRLKGHLSIRRPNVIFHGNITLGVWYWYFW